jgi:hypothetical protein
VKSLRAEGEKTKEKEREREKERGGKKEGKKRKDNAEALSALRFAEKSGKWVASARAAFG